MLTVNNRLARSVTQTLAAQYAQTSEIPLIAPWSGWLAHILTQLSFDERFAAPAYVLDSFSTQILWAQVIRDEERERPLMDVNQAAAAAMQADGLLEEWAIEVAPGTQTEEYVSFKRWRDAYKTRLHALDALDPTTQVQRIIKHLEVMAKDLHTGVEDDATFVQTVFPAYVVLAGFTEISPRMGQILDALSDLGVEVSVLSVLHAGAISAPFEAAHSLPPKISRILALNAQAEWLSAAHWARTRLSQDPQGRYAIVAAQLDREAPYARRVLDQVLRDGTDTNYPFNVAVARPLSEWRAGRAMLAWLRTFVLMKDQQAAEPVDLGTALLAGHCAGDQIEMGARARIDARWRDRQTTRVNVTGWSHAIAHLAELGPAWQLAWQAWQTYPRKSYAQEWSNFFRTTLSTLGFPGQAHQSSAAYQVTEALDALLDRFARMTPVLGLVTASDAWAMLNRLARNSPFQPQRDVNARLDVLGLLEAEGGHWDGVWILGLTDEVLPAAANPNPFIPLPALRAAHAPRATPEREFEWAQQIFEQLTHTAAEIIVSACAQEGERSLRPSPFIATVPIEQDQWTPSPIAHVQDTLAKISDERGPALDSHAVTSGGVNVLETQSCNPLWGFVRYRLGVQGLKPYASLPSKTLRGIYLHAVMQRIWEDLKTQEQLIAQHATGDLQHWIDLIVLDVARKKLQDYPEMWQQLEAERSAPLIAKWLEMELGRTPFVVTEIEQKRLMQIGSTASKLQLDLRLDRLDTLLSDGRQVVIDYKSGAKLPDVMKDWQHKRLVNIQLPSYAALMLDDVAANAQAQQFGGHAAEGLAGFILVQLHSKSVVAKGLIQEDIGLKGPKSLSESEFEDASWTAAMQRLHASITMLADEFLQGMAVNQSFNKNDLKYCDVLPILRIYASIQDDEETQDD